MLKFFADRQTNRQTDKQTGQELYAPDLSLLVHQKSSCRRGIKNLKTRTVWHQHRVLQRRISNCGHLLGHLVDYLGRCGSQRDQVQARLRYWTRSWDERYMHEFEQNSTKKKKVLCVKQFHQMAAIFSDGSGNPNFKRCEWCMHEIRIKSIEKEES